jgi:1-acyl-sn-glycerol-3-phosphate acyltransferase
MQLIRSIIFAIWFYIASLFWGVVFVPFWLLPKKYAHIPIKIWAKTLIYGAWVICGVKYKITGQENLPKNNGYIVASTHQSAWETLALTFIIPNSIFVVKRSLLFLPFIGGYMLNAGFVGLKRSKSASDIRSLIKLSKKALESDKNIIIFPQGTRMQYGERGEIKAGVLIMADKLEVPIIPIHLDSGKLWGRNSFIKKAGTIEVRILPALVGLNKSQLRAKLEEQIL